MLCWLGTLDQFIRLVEDTFSDDLDWSQGEGGGGAQCMDQWVPAAGQLHAGYHLDVGMLEEEGKEKLLLGGHL